MGNLFSVEQPGNKKPATIICRRIMFLRSSYYRPAALPSVLKRPFASYPCILFCMTGYRTQVLLFSRRRAAFVFSLYAFPAS
jgi:hypothetical protein